VSSQENSTAEATGTQVEGIRSSAVTLHVMIIICKVIFFSMSIQERLGTVYAREIPLSNANSSVCDARHLHLASLDRENLSSMLVQYYSDLQGIAVDEPANFRTELNHLLATQTTGHLNLPSL
jgi:hypothetical protein